MCQSGLERRIDEKLAAIRDVLASGGNTLRPAERGHAASLPAAADLQNDQRQVCAAQVSSPLEGALRELLDPMLRAWLLDNLGDLVHDLVEQELRRTEAAAHHRFKPPLLSQHPPRLSRRNTKGKAASSTQCC